MVVEIVLSLESVVVISSRILSIVVSDVLNVPKSSGTNMVFESVIPEVSIPKILILSKFSVLKLSLVLVVSVLPKSSEELKVARVPKSSIELRVPGELNVPVFSLTRVVPSGPVVSISEDVPVIVKLLVSSTDFTFSVPVKPVRPVSILLLIVPFSWQTQ